MNGRRNIFTQMGLEALCFRVVRPFVRAYVRAQAGAFCDRLAVDFQYFHWYRLFCSRITPTAFVSMQPALSANVHNELCHCRVCKFQAQRKVESKVKVCHSALVVLNDYALYKSTHSLTHSHSHTP